MNSSPAQTILALVVVVIAASYLIWRGFTKNKKPGCGSDCGCASDGLKDKLKR
jgi:hypothetical protein